IRDFHVTGVQTCALPICDDSCPEYVTASKSFFDSDVFRERDEATRDFYASFYDALSDGVYNLKPEDMTYENAYSIFDLINVARRSEERRGGKSVGGGRRR